MTVQSDVPPDPPVREICPETFNRLFGTWQRGDTMRCDYCNRQLTVMRAPWGTHEFIIPRHNTVDPKR